MVRFNLLNLVLSMSMLCSPLVTLGADIISLAGQWDIRHHAADSTDATRIMLPGSMLTNGIGNPVNADTRWTGSMYDKSYYYAPAFEKYRKEGNIKFPFFLTPSREYVGHAEYSKTVDIPTNWKGTDVTLFLERPHIETEVYVNSHYAGRDSSLSVPHRFNISRYLKPGKPNTIQIKIYNGIENVCVGQDSHSVTDQTQGNWNGITGRIELQSRPKVHIERMAIFPRVKDNSVDVVLNLAGAEGKKTTVTLECDGKTQRYNVKPGKDGKTTLNFNLDGDVRLWDEFSPYIYTMTASVGKDSLSEAFGMRDFEIRERQFYINGRPVFLRGTVENCNFPLTGFPPTDVESWLKVFTKCREYGLNHMRFHSYCPPEAAFEAADMIGFYLQPEGPSWPNHGVKLGNGMSIDRYLMEETQRMVEEYGNHPSFTMLTAGNEPAGNWVEWVGDFVDTWKATGDKRRVYCGASVGGGWAWDPRSEYHVKGGARGLSWDRQRPGCADDYAADMEKVTQKGKTVITYEVTEPRVGHETGQWCAYPDFNELDQYTGPYKAKNFEIFQETLGENGMASQFKKFLHASGKLQQLAYKYDIERNLRTPNYAGFQMLGLNDYSGQGTALVGVLNVLWNEKSYTDTEKWQSFCAPVVPLARFPKFVFTDDETVEVPVELYNASATSFDNANVTFKVTAPDGTEVEHISFKKDFAIGKNQPVGKLILPAVDLKETGKYNFSVTVGDEGHNDWDFWIYPSEVTMPVTDGLYITDTFDHEAEQVLMEGGDVLLTAAGKVKYGNEIKQHYLPVFWNTSWFKMRPPHTTGATIDTAHPVYKEFPTDDWTNLNWWELVNKAQVMNLDMFPKDYQSPMQPIDTWHLNRKLGMIVEGKVHRGKLFMTTLDIDSDLDKRPVARLMRKSILSYLTSDRFNPTLEIEPALIYSLYNKESDPVKMYTTDNPDELKPALK